MGYYDDTYADNVKPVLLDWLTNSGRGKNVSDLALSLCNRARQNLWAKKPWRDLVTDVTVTLTNQAYNFPDNFGRIIDIWGDLAGLGVPMYWYYEMDRYEQGYKLRDSYTDETGHLWTITFYYPQPAPINMRYQRLLEPLTGEGTEYTFFPSNLLLLQCQLINTREKGNIKEWQMLKQDFDEEFKDFMSVRQWVNYDPTPRLNDRQGHEIMVENYDLSGSGTQPYSPLPNSYLL